MLGVAESLSLRVNGLIDHIAELRRELFAQLLTKRYDINYALFGEVADDFYAEGAEFSRTVSCLGALRRPVQAELACWRRPSSRCWQRRCCWSAGAGCSAG